MCMKPLANMRDGPKAVVGTEVRESKSGDGAECCCGVVWKAFGGVMSRRCRRSCMRIRDVIVRREESVVLVVMRNGRKCHAEFLMVVKSLIRAVRES